MTKKNDLDNAVNILTNIKSGHMPPSTIDINTIWFDSSTVPATPRINLLGWYSKKALLKIIEKLP